MLPEHTLKAPQPYRYELGIYLLLPNNQDNNIMMLYPNTKVHKSR